MTSGTRRSSTRRPPEAESERTRRRFARRQWTRRWLTWKPVVAGVALLGVVGAAVWAVFFSAWLSVAGVEVRGTDLLSREEVRAAAAVPTGDPVATVDLAGVEARVEALAPVRSAEVSRQWPDQVLVVVEERVAVAVVELGGRLRGMDADGVVFRDYADPPEGLPRVLTRSGTTSAALSEGASVIAALPAEIAELVEHVEIETVDAIALALTDGRTVRWGSAEESEQKAEVLAHLLSKPGPIYDVSVPGQPTTCAQPALCG
ncbi:cell division protein FtsQ/DivIB [Nocardioides ferulae]|uniref:cell division protein FtsQ/DivIB n=1 Tax=Nocardioides ferulae TaxID=2340821 RepID=UPI000EB40879|nr:FtsQ-type POTRA domain-containing protein [Nocardioides ferulae]